MAVLRLRGLPWSAGEDEVKDFLQGQGPQEHDAAAEIGAHSEGRTDALSGLPPPQEVFIRKRGEKSTGEAFVEYETAEQATLVQQKLNQHNIGERYIEIFVSDAESLQALKEEVQEQDTGWVLRMRGLPFGANADDVLHFFGSLEVTRGTDGVVFTWGKDGRPLGEAYVEFPTEEAQEEALKLDRSMMGARYIELFKSTKADMVMRAAHRRQRRSKELAELGQALPQMGRRRPGEGTPELMRGESGMGFQGLYTPFPGPHMPHLGPRVPAGLYQLRVRGLPPEASADDVAHYFSDFEMRPEAVEMLMQPGRGGYLQATGMANVQFQSQATAEAAHSLQYHKPFGSRFIECIPLPPQLPSAGLPGLPRFFPGQQGGFAPPMGAPMGFTPGEIPAPPARPRHGPPPRFSHLPQPVGVGMPPSMPHPRGQLPGGQPMGLPPQLYKVPTGFRVQQPGQTSAQPRPGMHQAGFGSNQRAYSPQPQPFQMPEGNYLQQQMRGQMQHRPNWGMSMGSARASPGPAPGSHHVPRGQRPSPALQRKPSHPHQQHGGARQARLLDTDPQPQGLTEQIPPMSDPGQAERHSSQVTGPQQGASPARSMPDRNSSGVG